MSQLKLAGNKVLAVPEESGRIAIHELNWSSSFASPSFIDAHSSSVVQLSLNNDGDLIATASIKGTLIRVFHTLSRDKLYEFRRGSSYAEIYCLQFSENSKYLCTSSSTGTVHVFSLKRENSSSKSTSRSWFGWNELTGIKSFASFSVPPECKSICAFGNDQYVYAVSYNGSTYTYRFNEDGASYIENLQFFRSSSEENEEDEWFDAPDTFQ